MNDLATASLSWCRSDTYVELTPRQIALLGILCDEPGPHRVRVLAERIQAQKPVITRSMDRLIDVGAVRRTRDPNDRRDVILGATAQGREMRDAMKGEIR